MLSQKLRRGLAGLGVFAIGGLGLLAPTAAMADPPSFTDPSAVLLNKTVISNDSAFSYQANAFHFVFEPTKCAENGCVDVADIPDVDGPGGLLVNLTGSGSVYTGSRTFLPANASPTFSKPGVYAWTVHEDWILVGVAPSTYAFSNAQYLVRVAVKQGDSGLEYNWITITQLKDDKGDPVNEKVDSLDFVNVSEEVGDIEVTKRVVNNVGRNEEGPYEMEAVFTWPANFNGVASGDKWTETVPAVKIGAGQTGVTNASCTANQPSAGKTRCTFKLDKDATVKISDIPVGSTYTVTETSTGNYDKNVANGTGTVPVRKWQATPYVPPPAPPTEELCNTVAAGIEAGTNTSYTSAVWDAQEGVCKVTYPDTRSGPDQILVTVTNTYKDITPTGLMLEYLPYVLMVIIPLAGIGAYVAMRRKLLS